MAPRTYALAGLTATLLAAGVATSLPAPDAGAAGPKKCTGSLIYHKVLYIPKGKKHKPRKAGELDVYWNAKKKVNCAVFNHGGFTWGKKLYTNAGIGRCPRSVRNDGEQCVITKDKDFIWDDGRFAYRAGPVQIKPYHCISLRAGVRWKGAYYDLVGPYGVQKAAFCD